MVFQMNWLYVYRDESGKLRDNDGICNSNWPSFDSDEEAETFLENEDIRATVISSDQNDDGPFYYSMDERLDGYGRK